MTINLKTPDIRELKPHIVVFGVGGAGGNAVNNMISDGLQGCEFVVANTDAQALTSSKAKRIVQMGLESTQGLGAGSHPDVGRTAAEEVIDEIRDHLNGAHMAFITAGMGGGTGTGAAPVIARITREMGILTVGVVTKPFHFEGTRRMRTAEAGISELTPYLDTLIVIPNQNLFRIANEKTTEATTEPAPLPGKPGDKPREKQRFEFYGILEGKQQATPGSEPGAVVVTPAAPASSAASPTPTEAKSAALFFLQAGAFQKVQDADNLKAKLALMGLEASVQQVTVADKGTMQRVRVGPFHSPEEMNRARTSLAQAGVQATVVKQKE